MAYTERPTFTPLSLTNLALLSISLITSAGPVNALPPEASAREAPAQPRSSVTEFMDRIWGFATLYEDAGNPVLKKFTIRGRFQVDFLSSAPTRATTTKSR